MAQIRTGQLQYPAVTKVMSGVAAREIPPMIIKVPMITIKV